MTFAFHSDANDHPVFGSLSLKAFGLWALPGTWTSRNQSPGFVPEAAVAEIGGSEEAVEELVASGAWSRVDGGYKMEYGPSTDFPLPVWRYDDEPVAEGKLFEVVRGPGQ
ncbi:MAG TPA: hypothetical protein VNQ77_03820 [Frankiaceae bacterium]|nr:hypothetical protein [Frankiaceae bacterium]